MSRTPSAGGRSGGDHVPWGHTESSADPLLGHTQRLPPSNTQAEQALLGGLLANNRGYEQIAGFLRPEHFFDPVHGSIYAAIQLKIEGGQEADAITLRNYFDHTGVLDAVGGISYLAQLLTAMVSPRMAGDYGKTIFDLWRRRQLVDVALDLYRSAYSGDLAISETALSSISSIDTVIRDPNIRTGATGHWILDAADAALAQADEASARGGPVGLSTGFPTLDKMMMGMRDGNLHIIAARPGMGKSALGLQIADYVASELRTHSASTGERGGVVMISLEMSAEDQASRMISYRAGVPLETILRGEHEQYVDALLQARNTIVDMPLIIEDVPGMRMPEITLKVRSAERRLGRVRLIVIDHMHIVRADESDVRTSGTWAVGQISNALKRMAKEFDCPVVALAQLSRQVEGREDKRPTLADLRYAGEIEQDADVVAFIYREEYYLNQQGRPERKPSESQTAFDNRCNDDDTRRARARGRAEIILAKVRQGKSGTVHMGWNGATTSFHSDTPRWETGR